MYAPRAAGFVTRSHERRQMLLRERAQRNVEEPVDLAHEDTRRGAPPPFRTSPRDGLRA